MTAWRSIRLVARRELRSRRGAFRISTSLMVAVAVIGLFALELTGAAEGASISDETADEVLAFIGTVILFGTIVGYGQVVTLGVVEEKSSRVVEVVLGCVSPARLLTGKIIGIGLFALAQVGTVLAVSVGLLVTLDTVPVPPATPLAAFAIAGFFLLGYTFYATLYAAVGAMLSNTENASNAAGPLNIFVSIGYIVALTSLPNADSLLLKLASLLPPFTPIVMPIRIIQGSAAVWEVAVGIIALLAATYAITRLAGRLYIGGIMRGGSKTSFREAWRAAAL